MNITPNDPYQVLKNLFDRNPLTPKEMFLKAGQNGVEIVRKPRWHFWRIDTTEGFKAKAQQIKNLFRQLQLQPTQDMARAENIERFKRQYNALIDYVTERKTRITFIDWLFGRERKRTLAEELHKLKYTDPFFVTRSAALPGPIVSQNRGQVLTEENLRKFFNQQPSHWRARNWNLLTKAREQNLYGLTMQPETALCALYAENLHAMIQREIPKLIEARTKQLNSELDSKEKRENLDAIVQVQELLFALQPYTNNLTIEFLIKADEVRERFEKQLEKLNRKLERTGAPSNERIIFQIEIKYALLLCHTLETQVKQRIETLEQRMDESNPDMTSARGYLLDLKLIKDQIRNLEQKDYSLEETQGEINRLLGQLKERNADINEFLTRKRL